MASEPTNLEILGARPPTGAGTVSSSADWLIGGGELGELIRGADWSSTPLGARDRWSESLRTLVNLVVASRSPMCLLWGPELRLLYNDAYRDVVAQRHPSALGRPMRAVWPELWSELEPVLIAVMDRGESVVLEERPFRLHRRGCPEGTVFTLALSPLRLEGGSIGGVLATLQETTTAIESSRLRESEEQFSKAFLSSAIGLVISQVPEWRILQVNEGFTAAMGYRPEEVVGRTVLELGLWVEPEVPRRLEHGERILSHEVRLRRKDGSESVCLLSGDPVTIGGKRCVMVSFVDITERKRAEQEQKIVRDIVESSRDWIWAIDLDRRTIYSNHALETILGYSADEFQCMDLDLLHPEDHAVVNAAWPIWVESRRGWENLVVRWRAKDGSYRYVESTAVPILGPQGELLGFRGVDRDVTDRTHAGAEMKKLAAVVEHTTELVNLATLDGKMTFLNEAGSRMLGIAPDEVSRVHIMDTLAKPFVELGQKEVLPALLQGGSWQGDLQYVNFKTGQITDVFATTFTVKDQTSGKPLFLANVSTDITERKRIEEALRTSEAQLRASLENTPLVAVQWYDEDGRVLYWNQASESISGWKRAEACGKTLDALTLTPEQAAEFLSTLKLVRETGHPVGPYEVHIRRREGSAWVLSTTFAIPLGERRTGFVCMSVDITERKKAEEALRESDRRKTEFLAMLSHELRNPLAPIRNSIYILDRVAPGGERARRAQAVIERQVGHLTRLVDELLDITRIERGKIELKRERLDLNELTKRTAEDHHEVCVSSGLGLVVRLAPVEVWVDGDRTRLAQAIGNLLQNAVKFTPPGGSVEVSVESDARRGQAILTVRDTGAGFAPAMMTRLFEPFAQADPTLDRSKGGLGLGLAVVKGLVEMHGGSVSAASQGVGKGAEFSICLPLETTHAASREEPLGAIDAGSAGRVLVIEDNVDAADSLRDALELSGRTVVVAHDGAAGIDRAKTLRPEAVLCDIGLPGMDGYAVARALRADPELGHVTLVALTGYAGPEDQAKAKEAGFDVHLAKPPRMDMLERVLATAATRGR